MTQEHRASTNKGSKLKGGIAIAIGVALLAGGGGTLAYWTTTASVADEAIETGDLNMVLTPGTWSLTGVTDPQSPVPVADVTSVKVVPGDILTLVQPIDVTLIGDTLEADLTLNTDGLVAGSENFNVALEVTGHEPEGTSVRLTPDNTAEDLTATVTVTFSGATDGRIDTNAELNLQNIEFVLTQASS